MLHYVERKKLNLRMAAVQIERRMHLEMLEAGRQCLIQRQLFGRRFDVEVLANRVHLGDNVELLVQ